MMGRLATEATEDELPGEGRYKGCSEITAPLYCRNNTVWWESSVGQADTKLHLSNLLPTCSSEALIASSTPQTEVGVSRKGSPLRSKKKRAGATTMTAYASARVTIAELFVHAFLVWQSSFPRTQLEHVVTTPVDKLKSRQHAWLQVVLPSQGSLASGTSASSSFEVNPFFLFQEPLLFLM